MPRVVLRPTSTSSSDATTVRESPSASSSPPPSSFSSESSSYDSETPPSRPDPRQALTKKSLGLPLSWQSVLFPTRSYRSLSCTGLLSAANTLPSLPCAPMTHTNESCAAPAAAMSVAVCSNASVIWSAVGSSTTRTSYRRVVNRVSTRVTSTFDPSRSSRPSVLWTLMTRAMPRGVSGLTAYMRAASWLAALPIRPAVCSFAEVGCEGTLIL